jgi:hypothetical protein
LENLALGAYLDWMACRESCVAGQEKLEVSLREPSAGEKQKAKAVENRFASRFPPLAQAAGIVAGPAALVKSGHKWSLEIPFSGEKASRIDDFFPYPIADFVIEHGGIVCRDGKVIIPLVPSHAGASLAEVKGLFIAGRLGYEAALPVKK